MLLLISILSSIIGIIGTYFLIKMAVKHGIEAANQPKQEKDDTDDTNSDGKIKINEVLILVGLLLVLLIGYFTGVLD
jgi:hypothetical protein